jgi:hypothetical protein
MDRVFCKLEMSHAILDGTSVPILIRDLSQAYQGNICRRNNGVLNSISSQFPAPLYSDYIAHIPQSSDADINYWKTYLAGIEPCHLPTLNDEKKGVKKHRSLILELTEAL